MHWPLAIVYAVIFRFSFAFTPLIFPNFMLMWLLCFPPNNATQNNETASTLQIISEKKGTFEKCLILLIWDALQFVYCEFDLCVFEKHNKCSIEIAEIDSKIFLSVIRYDSKNKTWHLGDPSFIFRKN